MSVWTKQGLLHLARATGWGGVSLVLAGLAGIFIGIADFTKQLDLGLETLASMTLVAIGILLNAVAAQNARRAAELEELRQTLSVVEVRPLHMKQEFPRELARQVSNVQKFVLDTNLNANIPRFSGISPQTEYKGRLRQRLLAGEISFREVVCIFHPEFFEEVVEALVTFSNTDFYLRHFDPPPQAIPIIHMMSFDNEHFFVGGFHSAETSTQETVIYIRHPAVNALLGEYWQLLWEKATPLNTGRTINWQELEKISQRLSIPPQDFAAIRSAAEARIDEKRAAEKRLKKRTKHVDQAF